MTRRPILLIGGLDRRLVVEGHELILSDHGRLYGVAELRRVAPCFSGAPVFRQHADAVAGGTRTHIVGRDGRVGRVRKCRWDAALFAVVGELEPTPRWEDRFRDAADAGRLTERYSFSLDTDCMCVNIKDADGLLECELVIKFDTIFGVDLIEAPYVAACGGRFLTERMT